MLLSRVRFRQAALQGVLFEVKDFVELPPQVIEYRAQVKSVELLPSLLPELLQKVTQTLPPVSRRVAHPPLHEVAEGMLEVAEVHEIVGQAFEDVIGGELGDILGAVPHGIAET